ncbi:hypothetical protein [Paraburkholderia caffeinilytica]
MSQAKDVLSGCRTTGLWDEHLDFGPGKRDMRVFDTSFSRVACAICYDM